MRRCAVNGRDAMLDTMRAQLGYHAAADGSTKFGEWFAQLVGDRAYRTGDFCAMTLLWCANETGQLDLLGGARKEWAWVPSWWQHWRSIGRATSTPAPGRIVFFDFNRSGDPEHVGIVESVTSTGLRTLEGNTLGGQVARRDRSRADVLGYGDPQYLDTPAPGGDDVAMVVSVGA